MRQEEQTEQSAMDWVSGSKTMGDGSSGAQSKGEGGGSPTSDK